MPTDPRDITSLLSELEQQAREAYERGDLRGCERFAARALILRWAAYEADVALTTPNMPRKLTRMESAAPAPRRVGRPRTSPHAFPEALERAGTSVAAWARQHDLKRTLVASWFAPRPHGRAIPAKFAAEIQRDYGIPLDALPNGVRS